MPKIVSPSLSGERVFELPVALKVVGHASQVGQNPCQLLDLLCHMTAISHELAANLLVKAGVLMAPLTKEQLAAAQTARAFWNRVDAGRATYRSMVYLQMLKPASGDLAFYEEQELFKMLPGLRLPKALRRREYIVSLNSDEKGELTGLSLFSTRYTELAHHPF